MYNNEVEIFNSYLDTYSKINIENNKNNIYNLLNENIPLVKKKIKIESSKFIIPHFNEYMDFNKINYYIYQLKEICKYYNLKENGKKNDIIKRIYNFLYYSNYIIKIQRIFKRFLFKKLINLKGKALFNKKICVNDCDFYTLDKLEKIPLNQFVSIEINNKNFGFDICSLYNLFNKNIVNNNIVFNPYTREELNCKIFLQVKRIIKLSKILKLNLIIDIEDEIFNSEKIRFEQRVLDIFQIIDNLGNYTYSEWFTKLDLNKNIKLFREIQDIWNYRSQLPYEKKVEICPPYGNPFRSLNVNIKLVHLLNLEQIKNLNCDLMEELICKSVNNESKSLGAWIILTSLTLVSNDAAIAMPWLYESVIH